MKILIIGKTKSGKTTFGRRFAEVLDLEFHSMSEMFRKAEENDSSLTGNSISLLKEDLDCNLKYIENKFGASISDLNIVMEGFRNPYEFFKCFDKDSFVIVLNHSKLDFKDKFEEEGLGSIFASLKFLEQVGVQYTKLNFDSYEELDRLLSLTVRKFKKG